MKIIPTYFHGIFDYIGGVALLLAPEIFQFSEVGGAATLVPRIIGLIILVQSLMTDYEVGVFKVLPMKAHLTNDYLAGIFLAISPWLFGFNVLPNNPWVPHLVVGLTILFVTMLTKTVPERSSTIGHNPKPHAA